VTDEQRAEIKQRLESALRLLGEPFPGEIQDRGSRDAAAHENIFYAYDSLGLALFGKP
jgi:hypothetical protein